MSTDYLLEDERSWKSKYSLVSRQMLEMRFL